MWRVDDADGPWDTVATAATISAAALEAFRMLMSALENDDGTFDSPFRTNSDGDGEGEGGGGGGSGGSGHSRN